MSLDRRRGSSGSPPNASCSVLEDRFRYGLLRYEGDPLHPSRWSGGEYVISCGTLFKVLSAGVRLG